jgi:hypothetical protein
LGKRYAAAEASEQDAFHPSHDLPLSFGVGGRGDDYRDVHHPAALSDPLGEGVDPQVAVGARVERALPELVHLGVELGGHPGHLGLGDPLDAHGLDQVVDPAGGHALHVGLTDHRHQGLLGAPLSSIAGNSPEMITEIPHL